MEDREIFKDEELLMDGVSVETLERLRRMSPVQRELATLARTHAVIERARISVNNQARAPYLTDEQRLYYREVGEALEALEERCEKQLAQMVKQHPTWPWLSQVKGVGAHTAALILGYLLPPRADKGPSSWYKAAGLAPVETEDGTRLPRYTKGKRADWCPRLRRNLYVLGDNLVRARGYYYQRYRDFKQALAWLKQDWKPWRIHRVAVWKAVKLFLGHLWEVWCKAEGIPCRGPYPIAILGHDGYLPVPWEGRPERGKNGGRKSRGERARVLRPRAGWRKVR